VCERRRVTPTPSRDPLTIVGRRTVWSLLDDGATRHPSRPLLVYEAADGTVCEWSWADARARVVRAAAWLQARGVGPGDRVHVHLPNRPEFLLTWWGSARLGASIVPTNPLASADELAYMLRHAGARLSITDASGRETVRRAGGDVVDCDALALDAPAEPGLPAAPAPDDELGVLYTSGTTSRPKGVQVTHANYVYAGEVVARAVGLRAEDRFMAALPLFHANAQYYVSMSVLVTGATLVLVHGFSATGWLNSAVSHRATVASLFAAPIRMILARNGSPAERGHELRVVLFAQNISDSDLAHWDAVVGAPLLQLYGMTETIGPPLMNPIAGGRPDAIGRPTLGYSIRIVDDAGEVVPDGAVGELHVRGTPGVSLMAGYLDDPAATAAAIDDDGWLHTGDLVRLAADGLVVFVDREKDMIKRAGENVAATEVETVLTDHAAVADAAVVGVPDAIRDEQIVAWVVLGVDAAATADELIDWCAQRLARFRVPSEIHFTEDLPRTSVGKIRKQVLRDRWAAEHTAPTTEEEPKPA
jgi:crotonobetaine/carnitine-CoA ligase